MTQEIELQAIERVMAEKRSLAHKLCQYSDRIARRIAETDGGEAEEDVSKLQFMYNALNRVWSMLVTATAWMIKKVAQLVVWLGDCFATITRPMSSFYDEFKERIKIEAA